MRIALLVLFASAALGHEAASQTRLAAAGTDVRGTYWPPRPVRRVPLAPIPYSDLPTGTGSWDAGAGATTTITRALTVSGLLTATDITMTGSNRSLVWSADQAVYKTRHSTTPLHRWFTGAADTERMQLSAAALYPATNSGLTLGTSSLRWGGATYLGGEINASNGTVTARFGPGAFGSGTTFPIGTETNHDILFRTNDINRAQFAASGAFSPTSAGGITLGTSDLPWGSAFVGALTAASLVASGTSSNLVELQQTGTGQVGLRFFRAGGTAADWTAYIPSGSTDLRFFYSGADKVTLTSAGAIKAADGSATAPSLGFSSEATGLYKHATKTLGFAVDSTSLLLLKNPDGNPVLAGSDRNKQLALGNSDTSGYVLVNGFNYGGAGNTGNVLITGITHHSAQGDVLIRKYDGTNYTTQATFKADGTLLVGAPTGTVITGAGKINVAGDLYKNGTGYTNPDYVFETAYGVPARSAAPTGYRIRPLDETERYTREQLHLPGISRETSGIFDRADMLLEKVEELYLHVFELNRELRTLKAENRALRTQLDSLTHTVGVAR